MTLGDKISVLRRQHGWSQEALAEKLNISRQSISKWESNASVPDLDKIIRLSEIFQISTDYLLKEDVSEMTMNYISNHEIMDHDQTLPVISQTEVHDYIMLTIKVSKKIALGVSLCIFSPVVMLILYGFVPQTVTEKFAGGVGCSILLLFVAVGIALLIINGIRLNKYEYIEKESFSLDMSLKRNIEQQKDSFENTYRTRIALGVVLCIIGVLPLILSTAFTDNEQIYIWCTSLLLLFVSCGVFQFVWAGSIYGCYNKLLQIGDYTPDNKEIGNHISWFPGVYWCMITAIYLGISFYFNNWDYSWIIWPVAGVLFAALYQILRSIMKSRISK